MVLKNKRAQSGETQDKTLALFRQFLRDGLKLDNPLAIQLLKLLRLPQHPVFRNGEKINRPINAN